MSGVSKYACHSCEHVAYNRRMLALHVAQVHATKVYKCPICPFISCYQANLYRHKRLIHQQGRASKVGRKDADSFAQHPSSTDPALETDPSVGGEAGQDKRPNYLLDINETAVVGSSQEAEATLIVNNGYPALFNGFFDDSFQLSAERPETVLGASGAEQSSEVCADTVTKVKPQVKTKLPTMPRPMTSPGSTGHLTPVRFKRTYTCTGCDLSTTNPREYLAHRRDVHMERINIYECTLCMYASKNIQKLQRHYGLIHKEAPKVNFHAQYADQQVPPPPSRTQQERKTSLEVELPEENEISVVPKAKKGSSQTLKCSKCLFTTRSKFLLSQHEKNDHLRRKFFRCLQCGYVTNERGRYTKHVKYHSMPKQKCDLCDFETPYKWNMDRHIRNHMIDGNYKCDKCSFTAEGPKSLSFHVANHHRSHEQAASNDNTEEEIDVVTLDDRNEDDEQEEEDEIAQNDSEGYEEEEDDDVQLAYDEHSPLEEPYNPSKSRQFSTRRQTLPSEKKLKCKYCAYRTAWHSDLRRHEVAHKASKRHQCPLCGIGFDSLALVSRHLGRMHRQDSEAKNIASMIQLLTNKRKVASLRARSRGRMPILQRADSRASSLTKQSTSFGDASQSFLNPPLIDAVASVEKLQPQPNTVTLKRKATGNLTAVGSKAKKLKAHGSMTCNVCGYRTKWISELEKHMRVHSADKPFSCPFCEYSSRWKGDLTRHVQKYHEKLSRTKSAVERIGSSQNSLDVSLTSNASNDGDSYDQQGGSADEDGPLDLTVTKLPTFRHSKSERLRQMEEDKHLDFNQPNILVSGIQTIDVVDTINSSDTLRALLTKTSAGEKKSPQKKPDENSESNKNMFLKQIKKYKCPFCSFMTRTASRFHVHIIQHYNKRPFMCSACGKKSNWQWDITKHIKVKAERDSGHLNACVLLTDESGRKNYDKYDEYLVRVNEKVSGNKNQSNLDKSSSTTDVSKSDEQYEVDQFSVTGSQAPENIVVTPDISFVSAEDSGQEGASQCQSPPIQMPMPNQDSSAKHFKCAYCDYKHEEKKVVVGHLSVHAGISPFRCRICGFMSNWRQVMIRHVKGRHNGRLRDVQECFSFVQENKSIRLVGLLDEEVRKQQAAKDNEERIPETSAPTDMPSTNILECNLCPFKCDKVYFLQMHVKMHEHREGANFKCKFCPYYVKFKKTLYKHMQLHKDPVEETSTQHQTSIFVSNEEAEELQDSYQPSNTFTNLTDSGSGFSAGPAQNNHHYKTPKRYACEICPYQSDNKTYLLYHRQFHRPNKSAPFKCQQCSYWAYYLHLLKQHERIHQPAEVSAPEPNQIRFTVNNEYNLSDFPETSSAKDSAEKPPAKLFKCRFCPMTNKRHANVKAHEKMHWKHGALMHSCHLCSYRCGNRGVLTAHVKRVHQEYPLPQVSQSTSAQETSSTSQELLVLNQADNQADQTDTPPQPARAPKKSARFTYYCEHCPAAFKSLSDYNTHVSFHSANLPFSCPYCSYNARHKPHLHKHLIVHTADYIAKRAINPPAAVAPSPAPSQPSTASTDQPLIAAPSKSADQMLLLEETETKAYVTGQVGRSPRKLYKCIQCPAAFTKSTTLSYHNLLHGSSGEHKCSHCSYSTNSELNHKTHLLLHTMQASNASNNSQPNSAPPKLVRQFPCAKCPASFTKISRYNRHANLHGQNNRFTCDECDYSVLNFANLARHKKVHSLHKNDAVENEENQEQSDVAFKVPDNAAVASTSDKTAEKKEKVAKTAPCLTERATFGCSRCPYSHNRKDAVVSHMNRHSTGKGIKCPHCDYHTLQPSYITEHMKKHFQPIDFYKVDAFVHFNSIEIWASINGDRRLLCKDAGSQKDISERFDPPIEDQNLLESLRVSNVYEDQADADPTGSGRGEPNAADKSEQKLIEDAMKQSKKLEVVLTDVLGKVKTEDEVPDDTAQQQVTIKQERVETEYIPISEAIQEPPHISEAIQEPPHKSEAIQDPDSKSTVLQVVIKSEVISDEELSAQLNEAEVGFVPDAAYITPPREINTPVPAEITTPRTFLDSEETLPYEPEHAANRVRPEPCEAKETDLDTGSEARREQEDINHGNKELIQEDVPLEEIENSPCLILNESDNTSQEVEVISESEFTETVQNDAVSDAKAYSEIDMEQIQDSSDKLTAEWNAEISGCGDAMDVIVEDLYPQVGDSVVEIVTDEPPNLKLTDDDGVDLQDSDPFNLGGNIELESGTDAISVIEG